MEEHRIKNRSNLLWGAICASLLVVGAVFIYLLLFRPYERTNDALIDGFKVAVCPDITARIMKLYVDEGDIVKKGDLLCDLDDTIPQSEKVAAGAKIAAAEARLMLERFHLKKIRNDFKRAQKGFEDNVVSVQDWDHAEKNFLIAKANVDVASKNLKLAKRELEVIETKLMHTKVLSSINGIIVKRWLYEGDVPRIGQAIFSLYDLDTTWVLANLEETKMENVRIGDPVEIHFDTYPGKTFHGKIFVIKGAAASEFSLLPQDNATGNYTKVAQRIPLKISIDRTEDSSYYFFPGMSAEVRVRTR